MGRTTYSDDELRLAVAGARSWRGVLRDLGLQATSSQAVRSVRRNSERLGLDHGHFTGQRRWSEEQLREAVGSSRTWGQVAATLGLRGGSSNTALKGHAARLGIDASHISRPAAVPPGVLPMDADVRRLSRAGEMIAAAWFTLSGHRVSWPQEPCRYDLVVERSGAFERVQVKTTILRRDRSWVVSLTSNSAADPLYDPEEIDYFFIVDGELECYLIPVATVGGLRSLNLSAYQHFRLSRPTVQPT